MKNVKFKTWKKKQNPSGCIPENTKETVFCIKKNFFKNLRS